MAHFGSPFSRSRERGLLDMRRYGPSNSIKGGISGASAGGIG